MDSAPTEKSSRLVQKIKVRREGNPLGEFPTRSLIEKIRSGDLAVTDEFSGDGNHWSALGRHPQLAPYFEERETPVEPPRFRQQLKDMAGLLDDLNLES